AINPRRITMTDATQATPRPSTFTYTRLITVPTDKNQNGQPDSHFEDVTLPLAQKVYAGSTGAVPVAVLAHAAGAGLALSESPAGGPIQIASIAVATFPPGWDGGTFHTP